MRPLALILLALVLAGCDEERHWNVRYVPTTDAERKAVAEQVEKIMAASHASSLAGHDQDLDDAIRAATTSALETLCQPTLRECREYGIETGRWRYLDGPLEKGGAK